MINDPCKAFKNICFWDTTHMDLWKYSQILTIQKSLIIKQLGF
jgi:hypothetical protein